MVWYTEDLSDSSAKFAWPRKPGNGMCFQAIDMFLLCSHHEELSVAFGVGMRSVDRCVEMVQHGINGILLESTGPAPLAKIRIEVLPNEEVFDVCGNLVKEKFDTAGMVKVFRLYFSL